MNIPRTTFIAAVSGFSQEEAFPLDLVVRQTVEDQVKGVDRYMSEALDLIGEKTTNP